MGTILDAVVERASGGQPSRFKSFLAATAVGFTAATLTYRVMRRGASSGDDDAGDGDSSGGS